MGGKGAQGGIETKTMTQDGRQDIPVAHTVGLTRIFRDFWRRPRVVAVKDLDLKIERGEVFGLLGPNGSGKSTTIKILLGLLYPTRGRVAVFGKPPTDVEVKRRIGFLPEESYLYRFLDARETLDYYGRLFRLPRRVRINRTHMLLDLVGLSRESGRKIGEYSKGMARRIGLAQALINDPEFLILDEPTSGLDPVGTRQIKDIIRELGQRGKTILLSSHLLGDVEDVCDRVTILYGGHRRAQGTLDELLARTDQLQFTTGRLKDETVAAIREVIRRREGLDILALTKPRQKLEDFFLSIVEEARRANLQTSGAGQSAVSFDQYLEGDRRGDALIEALAAASVRRSVPPTQAEEVAVAPDATEEVLSGLMAAGERRSHPRADEAAREPARKAPQVDESLIEGLVKSSTPAQRKSGGGAADRDEKNELRP